MLQCLVRVMRSCASLGNPEEATDNGCGIIDLAAAVAVAAADAAAAAVESDITVFNSVGLVAVDGSAARPKPDRKRDLRVMRLDRAAKIVCYTAALVPDETQA